VKLKEGECLQAPPPLDFLVEVLVAGQAADSSLRLLQRGSIGEKVKPLGSSNPAGNSKLCAPMKKGSEEASARKKLEFADQHLGQSPHLRASVLVIRQGFGQDLSALAAGTQPASSEVKSRQRCAALLLALWCFW